MMIATIGPLATSATRTATTPLINAPTTGMNAPTKTRIPIALTSGRPRIAAPSEMPIASTAATTMVARTNAVSETHAFRPDESALSRACRGNSRTTQAQICSPW